MNYLADSNPMIWLPAVIIGLCCLVPVMVIALITMIRLIIKQRKNVKKLKKYQNDVSYLDFFGDDNIVSVSKNLSRVTVEVKNIKLVDFEALKSNGVGVMITENTIKCSSQAFADQIE